VASRRTIDRHMPGLVADGTVGVGPEGSHASGVGHAGANKSVLEVATWAHPVVAMGRA
jgi:hypothetical protein